MARLSVVLAHGVRHDTQTCGNDSFFWVLWVAQSVPVCLLLAISKPPALDLKELPVTRHLVQQVNVAVCRQHASTPTVATRGASNLRKMCAHVWGL